MTHRPYPNTDRARHQVDRHEDETPPYRKPRPMTPTEKALVGYATAAVRAAAPAVAAMKAAFAPRPAGSEEKTA